MSKNWVLSFKKESSDSHKIDSLQHLARTFKNYRLLKDYPLFGKVLIDLSARESQEAYLEHHALIEKAFVDEDGNDDYWAMIEDAATGLTPREVLRQ